MNPPVSATLSPTAAAPSASLYQRMLLHAFANMPRGQLRLELPDGTQLEFGCNGDASWPQTARSSALRDIPATATLRVTHADFFRKCVLYGDIGFAESYLDGDWETPDLRAIVAWFLLNLDAAPTLSGSSVTNVGLNLLRAANRVRHHFRPNSREQAVENIREHYDLSNDFFALWLDPNLMYSGARWDRPDATLEEAQQAKNDALCRKLQLKPQDHVLEIGTGWGGWSIHAARVYGCRVTSLTISVAQANLARTRIKAAGLSHLIEVRLQDYRDLPAHEVFDKVVSIEMLEAVGHKYLDTWCSVVSRVLKPDGLLALQFITCPDGRYEALRRGVDFVQKHIFPGSLLLSINRLNTLLSANGGFVLNSLEDGGSDYARTLRLWRAEFARQLPAVTGLGFDRRFIRKWDYYLAYCEAAFAMRNVSVVQTIHTRANNLTLR